LAVNSKFKEISYKAFKRTNDNLFNGF